MICKHKYALASRTCKKEIYKDGYCKSHYIIPKNTITNNKNKKNITNEINNNVIDENEFVGNLLLYDKKKINEYGNRINELKNIQEKLFTFLDARFDSIINVDTNEIWLKSKEMMEYLEYGNTNRSLNDLVREKNIKKIRKYFGKFQGYGFSTFERKSKKYKLY